MAATASPERSKLTVVGAGAVATALAGSLRQAGVPVLGLWARRPEAARAAAALDREAAERIVCEAQEREERAAHAETRATAAAEQAKSEREAAQREVVEIFERARARFEEIEL